MRRGEWSMMSGPHAVARGKCSGRRKLDLILANSVFVLIFASLRHLRNRVEQRPHQSVQFRVGDEMGRLLPAERSSQHTRKAQHRAAAASETTRSVIRAEQLTLYAKHSRLQ